MNERHAEFSLLPSPAPVGLGDTVFLFKGNEVLLRTASQENRLPMWGEVKGGFAGIAPRHAFSQGNRRYFIADADTPAPPGFAWENIRVFRTLLPVTDGALLNAARHLSVWYQNNRFCGACGGAMQPHSAQRALVCERCGLIVFPSVLPAVIVAVLDGGRLLLARNAQGVFRHFSLIAGFVEVGETAEQAVKRKCLRKSACILKISAMSKASRGAFPKA